MNKILFALFWFFCLKVGAAPCIVKNSQGQVSKKQYDALFLELTEAQACPQNVEQLSELIKDDPNSIDTFMVANRGRRNPALGSFSFFEMTTKTILVDGQSFTSEIFFGHFSHRVDGEILLDQSPSYKKLVIEAISFDIKKEVYNFYELIGLGDRAQWYYRGDSLDALLDNEFLYRQVPKESRKFGIRMRCSACHNSGGPIMKEIDAPYNDWWTEKKQLIFAPNALSAKIQQKVDRLKDAGFLAQEVIKANEKLLSSKKYIEARARLSLPEQLRPLFCTSEINLRSSQFGIFDQVDEIFLPLDFFSSELIEKFSLSFSASMYKVYLKKYNLFFPETNLQDADHMWLTPVKSFVEKFIIENLVKNKIISLKHVKDILMFDFKNPVLSDERCQLLRFVPDDNGQDWMSNFINNLHLSGVEKFTQLAKILSDEKS
ncbi:MAG: hypothetical protein KC505_05665, partial [Myxococcales bacterium]|nr:hypothetical protein [Myxococcales bacterium]